MTRRRHSIPERKPVFIGCEGESECAYAQRLQDMLRDEQLPIHLVIENLGNGAGDPFARVQLAVQRLEKPGRTRIARSKRFLLLDHDQVTRDPLRGAAATALATKHGMVIVWQRPCFEALLLRHLPNRASHQPPGTQDALRALQREWPNYGKPMTRTQLAGPIDREALSRAAGVEPELRALLRCIGLEK